MRVVTVPCHLDEHLPDLGFPLAAAVLPEGPLYVHIDLDVIDPGEVPGLRYPAPGGPGTAQVAGALEMLLGTGRVAAVGLACTWHPGHAAAAGLRAPLRAALESGGDPRGGAA